MPLWWACCTAWQTWVNSSSRVAGGQAVLVAVVGDRHALDQLHDEVGSAASRLAGIEHLGDVRMVHERQGLALGLEAGDHLPGVHARLEDLEGHLTAHRLLLLGHEHQAEAAFADLLQQLVGTDDRARPFPDRLSDDGERPDGGRLQKTARRRVGIKQVPDAAAQLVVAVAGLGQVAIPLVGRQLDGRHKNLFFFSGDRVHCKPLVIQSPKKF